MTLEEKVLAYKDLRAKISALEEERQKIYQEILSAFPANEKLIEAESFQIKKHTRLNIKTTLEEARAFNATKTDEIVDKDKIKELVFSGTFVPNVTESNYFFIHNRIDEPLENHI
jgi:hypothetical protein